jgi:hypothetical protein
VIQDRLALNFEIAARLRDARSRVKLPRAPLAERGAGRISAPMTSSCEGAQRRSGVEEARLPGDRSGYGRAGLPALRRDGDVAHGR